MRCTQCHSQLDFLHEGLIRSAGFHLTTLSVILGSTLLGGRSWTTLVSGGHHPLHFDIDPQSVAPTTFSIHHVRRARLDLPPQSRTSHDIRYPACRHESSGLDPSQPRTLSVHPLPTSSFPVHLAGNVPRLGGSLPSHPSRHRWYLEPARCPRSCDSYSQTGETECVGFSKTPSSR